MEKPNVRISVVVCTYNPVNDVFSKCLDAISAASLYRTADEMLIIDNNSTEPVVERNIVREFLNRNASAKVIKETKQGLTPTRLRGICESTGQLIIFVDDDNIIDSNYFSVAADIFSNYPFIGAFSGQATLEYAAEPGEWTKKYWGMLIYRQLKENKWSNIPFNNDTMPHGAGLCITRDVADQYIKLFKEGKRLFNLDRSKDSLMSGGDNDLAMCACDIGKGMGLFRDLHLRHYIFKERFTLPYLSKLAYGIYFSSAMLLYMRTGRVNEDSLIQNIKHLISAGLMKKNDRVIQHACKRGWRDAVKLIKNKHKDL